MLNSVASVYYYFLIVNRMFFTNGRTEEPLPIGIYLGSTLAVAAVGVLVLGIYPEPLISASQFSAKFLP